MKSDTFSALAVINKVQTTTDGGTRVTLDFSESDILLAQKLMEMKFKDGQVVVAFQKIDSPI